MSNDKEWMFDLGLTILASPFILLVGLARATGKALVGAVRNRQTSLERIKGETEMMKALADREAAAASLRERERQNQPERAEPEVVLEEPSLDDSDEERARKRDAAEAKYARVVQDEERRLAGESLSEAERREWQNFYAQKRRDIREEIRKWM